MNQKEMFRFSSYLQNSTNPSREHYSEHDLTLLIEQENQTKKSVSFSENISQCSTLPCDRTNLLLTLNEQKRYGNIRRCQTDIIVVDPVLHLHTFTDSPPNEFRLQADDDDDDDNEDDDEILMEKSQVNIVPNLDEPVPLIKVTPSSPTNQIEMFPMEKVNDQSLFDEILEKITDVVKRLFEVKRSDKTFILNNENNSQLDLLLKNDFCTVILNILEHGRIDLKKITIWKIIETSIDNNPSSSRIYYEAKQIAKQCSSYWLYKFQAFIFILLNKNELVNWLYYFTRQKDFIQRYYQLPDALILVAKSITFNQFERIMTQLEKLTTLSFNLTYHITNNSTLNDEQMNTSMVSTHSIKTSARDWVMTISRRTSNKMIQPTITTNNTFRSTLTKKINAIFTKTNSSQQQIIENHQHIKSPNDFSNQLTGVSLNQPIRMSSPKLNSVLPSGIRKTFQSKIPRPSLNVDKPKSVRYRSTTLSPN